MATSSSSIRSLIASTRPFMPIDRHRSPAAGPGVAPAPAATYCTAAGAVAVNGCRVRAHCTMFLRGTPSARRSTRPAICTVGPRPEGRQNTLWRPGQSNPSVRTAMLRITGQSPASNRSICRSRSVVAVTTSQRTPAAVSRAAQARHSASVRKKTSDRPNRSGSASQVSATPSGV